MIYHGNLKVEWSGASRRNLFAAAPASTLVDPATFNAEIFKRETTLLEQGHRLTLFNTIAAGDVFWEGAINPASQNQKYHNKPEGIAAKNWRAMFDAALPAILQKADGRVIHGALDAHWEQGFEEHALWLRDFEHDGYDACHSIDAGDTLRVFSAVSAGNILWQGAVNLGAPYSTGRKLIMPDPAEELPHIEKEEMVENPIIEPPNNEFSGWVGRAFPALLER